MGNVAKRLLGATGAAGGYVGQTLRAYFVYLTIFGIVGCAWFAAWTRSIDHSHRRLLLPPFGKNEVPEYCGDEIDDATRAELDAEAIGE